VVFTSRAQPFPQDSKKPPAASSGAEKPTVEATVDQILARYMNAVGGRKAWRALYSRVSMGTIDVTSMNLSGTVVMHEKAPNKLLTIIILAGSAFREAFDGKSGWSEDPADGLREESGLELADAKRQADFYGPFDLHGQYSKMTFVGREKIGERETYALEGALPEGSQPDRLYFDVDTGLLVRLITQHHAPEGVSQLQQDFSDYREIDGVKLPFAISQTSNESAFTIKINEVHHNVALGDSEFSKPAVQ
jgi:zinc protease